MMGWARWAAMWNMGHRAWGAGGEARRLARGPSRWSRRETMVVWTRTVAMGGKGWTSCKALLLWWMKWAGGGASKSNVTILTSDGQDREPQLGLCKPYSVPCPAVPPGATRGQDSSVLDPALPAPTAPSRSPGAQAGSCQVSRGWTCCCSCSGTAGTRGSDPLSSALMAGLSWLKPVLVSLVVWCSGFRRGFGVGQT